MDPDETGTYMESFVDTNDYSWKSVKVNEPRIMPNTDLRYD